MRFVACKTPPLPAGHAVFFNGERCKPFTVVEADDETGLIIRIGWDADGHVIIDEKGEPIETTEHGRVEFRLVCASGASPEASSPSA